MQPEPNIRPAMASDEFALFTLVNQLHESISVEKTQFEAVFTTVLREPRHRDRLGSGWLCLGVPACQFGQRWPGRLAR